MAIAAALFLSAAGLSNASEPPQHPAAHIASPDMYKQIFTNSHVRVLTMTLQPGKSDRWHHHPAETVYFEKGGTLRIHLPDGNAVTKEVADGEVMWHEAWVHRVENAGTTEVKAVIVEDISPED